jgi:hypothetical protein
LSWTYQLTARKDAHGKKYRTHLEEVRRMREKAGGGEGRADIVPVTDWKRTVWQGGGFTSD